MKVKEQEHTMTHRKVFTILFSIIAFLSAALAPGLTVSAEPVDYAAEADARKSLPVESNSWEGWPYGPEIGAQSAILMEAETGTILYAKNIHEQLYPASITKILTGLITMEQCALDEMVTCSYEAVSSIDWRSDSNIDLRAGEQITVEQALYGLLVGSANEVANALGEHISGSMEDFADLMNQRARELGCVDSNFVTTNGIFDVNHYTSVYDMALIAQEFFSHDLLCKMSSLPTYTIPQSATVGRDLNIYCKNKLLEGKEYEYEYLVGSKTGYTSESRQNLVSCAEKDGMRLICVIMKEEAPNQFTDTINLFNYGFNNFQMINISETDEHYTVKSSSFFSSDSNIFGKSEPLLSIDPSGQIVIPNTAAYEDVLSTLTYDHSADSSTIASLDFTYNGVSVGSASVQLAELTADNSDQAASSGRSSWISRHLPVHRGSTGQLFINVKYLAITVLAAAALIYTVINLIVLLMNYNFTAPKRKDSRRRKRRKSENIVNLDRYIKDDDDDPYII